MPIAITKVASIVAGNMRGGVYDITLDGAYAAGGYPLTAANLGLPGIVWFQGYCRTAEKVEPQYDHTNAKLMVLKGASTVTVTSGNAAYSELATNDTLVSTSTVVRSLVLGVIPNTG